MSNLPRIINRALLPFVAVQALPGFAGDDSGAGVLGDTVWETLERGGSVMFVILGLSIIGLGFILDAAYRTRRGAILPPSDTGRLRGKNGHQVLADMLKSDSEKPLHRVLKTGHHWRHGTPEQIQTAIEEVVDQMLWRFKRSVKPLGIIANTAPLLGLLGTVIGIVQAFDVVAQQGALGDPGKLAGGISKALLTTCFGLIVAIPMLLAYHYFNGKVEGLLKSSEELGKEIFILPPDEEPADQDSQPRRTEPATQIPDQR